jgi:hypothetical protein
MGTQALFAACVGRVFPIAGTDNGLLELHVGEVVGEESYMHSIWIEPNCLLLRPYANDIKRTTNMTYAPKIVLELPVSNPELLQPFVEACLRDGVDLIAIVGEGASRMDDLIDEIVVGDGSDRNRFINTTFHADETVDEVLEFARSWKEELGQAVQLVKL